MLQSIFRCQSPIRLLHSLAFVRRHTQDPEHLVQPLLLFDQSFGWVSTGRSEPIEYPLVQRLQYKTDRTVCNDLYSPMHFLTYCWRHNRMAVIEVGSPLLFPFIFNHSLLSWLCNLNARIWFISHFEWGYSSVSFHFNGEQWSEGLPFGLRNIFPPSILDMLPTVLEAYYRCRRCHHQQKNREHQR